MRPSPSGADAIRAALLVRHVPASAIDRLFARAALATDSRPAVVEGFEAGVLLDRIAAVLTQGAGDRLPAFAILEVGRELDFLGETRGDVRDGIAFLRDLDLLAQADRRATRKAAVVATIRNEGPYILEWLGHLQAVGFEHVFVYTNDNADSSDTLLLRLAEHGAISLVVNTVDLSFNPQIKAYDHALHFLPELRDFEWVMFLDADEFFVPAERYGHQVGQMLDDAVARCASQDVASISFNWIWMGSGGHRSERLEEPLSRRFVSGLPHYYVKSIVRPEAVKSMVRVHKPVLFDPYVGVDAAFARIEMSRYLTPFAAEAGEIRHYWHKSFEEFLVKQARGTDRPIWERGGELFFLWDHGEAGRPYGMPDVLVECASRAKAEWLAVPAIAEAHRVVLDGYRRLAAQARGGRPIEDLYREAEIEADIFRILAEASREGGAVPEEDASALARALSGLLTGR